jgi:hypothetical protein
MTEPEIELLEKVLQVERSSFIGYVVEGSEPELHDEFDRRVFAFYEDWARECARSQDALVETLEGKGESIATPSFPLEFSQFNYLGAGYLLQAVISRMADHVRALEDLGRGLPESGRARELVSAIIERHEIFLKEARKLDTERPPHPPKPPRIKGTSASRW